MSKAIKILTVALACVKITLAQTSWQLQVEYSGKTFFDTQVMPESTYHERTEDDKRETTGGASSLNLIPRADL